MALQLVPLSGGLEIMNVLQAGVIASSWRMRYSGTGCTSAAESGEMAAVSTAVHSQ